jgi:hypothetical protein
MVHAAPPRATKFFRQPLTKRFVASAIRINEAKAPARSLAFDHVDAGDLA